MAAVAAEWAKQWAGQLADVADHVIKELPDKDDWNTARHFLSNTSRALRKGDVKTGFRVIVKVLPYVQRAISSVEKCNTINSSFDITETVSRHFLVDKEHKENINDLLEIIQGNVIELRTRVSALSQKLDLILDDVIDRGKGLSWWQGVKLAFEINRISALIKTCEDRLNTVRSMIDELDSHVASKSFLAYLFTYIAFLLGIAFSASGNVTFGTACLSAATASRTAAKSLDGYRKDLLSLENKHTKLQEELTEWRHKYAAERLNFLLLFGPQKAFTILVVVLVTLLLIGHLGNMALFSLMICSLLFKSYVSESNRYTLVLAGAVLSVWIENRFMYGLVGFNFFSAALFLANYIGIIEFWW